MWLRYKIRTRALLQVPAVCLQKQTQGYYNPSRHSGVCQISDQSGILGGAGWPHLTHTNFQSRELRAITSYLAFHHNYSLKQIIGTATWRNNILSLFLLFMTIRDLPLAGDGTMTGPLVAGQKVIPWRHLGNSETSRCGLLTISSTALNTLTFKIITSGKSPMRDYPSGNQSIWYNVSSKGEQRCQWRLAPASASNSAKIYTSILDNTSIPTPHVGWMPPSSASSSVPWRQLPYNQHNIHILNIITLWNFPILADLDNHIGWWGGWVSEWHYHITWPLSLSSVVEKKKKNCPTVMGI